MHKLVDSYKKKMLWTQQSSQAESLVWGWRQWSSHNTRQHFLGVYNWKVPCMLCYKVLFSVVSSFARLSESGLKFSTTEFCLRLPFLPFFSWVPVRTVQLFLRTKQKWGEKHILFIVKKKKTKKNKPQKQYNIEIITKRSRLRISTVPFILRIWKVTHVQKSHAMLRIWILTSLWKVAQIWQS